MESLLATLVPSTHTLTECSRDAQPLKSMMKRGRQRWHPSYVAILHNVFARTTSSKQEMQVGLGSPTEPSLGVHLGDFTQRHRIYHLQHRSPDQSWSS